MEKGDIVLVPFPFTNLAGSKNRPALVLISTETDATLAFISTQLKWKEKHDLVLKPDSANGLKTESLVRLAKLATVEKDLILGKLGKIDKQTHKQLNQNLFKLLKSGSE